jgi:hypothetical protein
MATEREILERAKKFEFSGGIPEMRDFVNHNAKALNAKPPEIGAYHPDVELRPGLRADICVPKGGHLKDSYQAVYGIRRGRLPDG